MGERCGEWMPIAREQCARKPHSPATSHRTRKALDAAAKRTADRIIERQDIVQEIKTALGCADCGYDAHPAALDFDHVRGIKQGHVSSMRMLSGSLDALLDEIGKCDVVCANCHRVRTASSKGLAQAKYSNPSL